jgi:hypothetical protein
MVYKDIRNGNNKMKINQKNKFHLQQMIKIYYLINIKFIEIIGIKFVIFLMDGHLKSCIIDFNMMLISSLKKVDGQELKI